VLIERLYLITDLMLDHFARRGAAEINLGHLQSPICNNCN